MFSLSSFSVIATEHVKDSTNLYRSLGVYRNKFMSAYGLDVFGPALALLSRIGFLRFECGSKEEIDQPGLVQPL